MKRICAVMCSLVMLCSSGYAAGVKYTADFDNGDMKINGVIDGTEYNRLASVEITAEDGSTLFVQTIPVKTDGSYSSLLKLPETMESGDYTLMLRSYGNGSARANFTFIDKEDALGILNKINDASADEDDIEGTIRQNPSVLNLPSKYYVSLTEEQWEEIAAKVFTEKSNGEISSLNEIGELIVNDIAIWAMENALNANDVKDVLNDFENTFAINKDNANIKLYNVYKNFGNTEYDSVNKILAESNPKTIESFYSELDKAAFTVAVSVADEPVKVIELIDTYANDVGLDLTYYNQSVALQLMGKNFGSLKELEDEMKSAYDTITNNNNSTNNGSGGGAGGGGGGGSSAVGVSGNAVYTEPNTSQEKEENSNIGVFKDIDGVEWAKNAIVALAEKNIISGDGDGSFRPNDNITREEFVKILVAAFGITAENAEANFADVKTSDWSYPYVAIAYKSGIVNGVSETEFGSGKMITRQDMAVMAANAARLCGIVLDGTAAQFADEGEIADYAVDAVSKMSGAGIINGFTDGSFRPSENASRAQAAKIIYALIEK